MNGPIQVAAGILVRDGRILLGRRRAEYSLGGLWEFPGGKLEPGETPETCLVREFQEEFAMAVKPGNLLCRHSFSYSDRQYELIAHWLTSEEEPSALHAHEEVHWAPPGELLQMALTPADVPVAHRIISVGLPNF